MSDSTRTSSSQNERPASRRLWLWPALLIVAAIAVYMQWDRFTADSVEDPPAGAPAGAAERGPSALLTELAARVPAGDVSPSDLAAALERLTDRRVDENAAAEVEALVSQRIVALLWTASQKIESDPAVVSRASMEAAVAHELPTSPAGNGAVTLYPDSSRIAVTVSSSAAERLADEAWPWRWIDRFIADASPRQMQLLKDIEPDALDVMGRGLAVTALALVELAARSEGGEGVIGQAPVVAAFKQIALERGGARAAGVRVVEPDTQVRRALIESLPDPLFTDVTTAWGLDFVHRPDESLQPARARLDVPFGVAGGGVAAADLDGDGWIDLYLAGDDGGRLYRNNGGPAFTDITERTLGRLGLTGETRAGYFIDFDNDGDRDLFLTFVAHPNRLLRNDGGVFVDVSRGVGLAETATITHEAVWTDINNDGLLDLYVSSFGPWTEGSSPDLGADSNTDAPPNRLYVQRLDADGTRRFEDITAEAGVGDTGWTHCVAAFDYDADGRVDLFSLNDFGTSRVYRNTGDERFVEVAHQLGFGELYNAMNFTLIDLDHSGRPAMYITQIMDPVDPRQVGARRAADQIIANRLGRSELLRAVRNKLLVFDPQAGAYTDAHPQRVEGADLGWAWGASAFDYQNDAEPDLLVVNGTEPESRIPTIRTETRPAYLGGRAFMAMFADERNALLMSRDGYFFDLSDRSPVSFAGNSRSAAAADIDNDGDPDLVISGFNEPARVFENVQRSGNHFVRFKLVGTRSNRDAIGAAVEARFGGSIRHAWVASRTGFLAQEPLAVHFGLGGADRVDRVVIRWPSGTTQTLETLEADTTHTIIEPDTEPAP